jgi:phosphoglycolate phosphatase
MTNNNAKFANVCNIIFDLDGTLIDSSEGIIAAANHAFGAMGITSPAPDIIRSYIGYPLDKMYNAFDNGRYDQFLDIFREFGNKVIVDSARPLDGVEITLGMLKHYGRNFGVATTKCRHHLDAIVGRLGWINYFDSLCGGDEVQKVKPDPEQILKVMGEMSATKDNTIVVGDTVNDIEAAHAAGLPAVAIKSPYGKDRELQNSRPELILDFFGQLPEYLVIDNDD